MYAAYKVRLNKMGDFFTLEVMPQAFKKKKRLQSVIRENVLPNARVHARARACFVTYISTWHCIRGRGNGDCNLGIRHTFSIQ